MRLLFDQNISYRIVNLLSQSFEGSTTVKAEKLTDKTDKEIWNFAKSNHFTIVTQDSDFNDLTTLYGFPPKVIWIRTGNLNTNQLADVLNHHESVLKGFFDDAHLACFEVFAMRK